MKININKKGLDHLRSKLHVSLDSKINTLCEKLCVIGAAAIQQAYQSIKVDGNKEFTVTYEKDSDGYKIIASGQAVAFIEYGAGVYFNASPVERPAGISGIGEYGHGLGNQQYWHFYNESAGHWQTTRGNPAASGLVKAINAMREAMPKLISEVWRND